MALREDLIQSAVEFLKDPSISDSPLNKRIEFIESKGLNQDEIQEALKRSQTESGTYSDSGSVSGSGTSASVGSANTSNTPSYYPNPPPLPERDWKDYFIMASSTIGVTYGVYQIVTRYLLPNILPPSKEKLEAEKESIDQEFARIEKLLDTLDENQKQFIELNNDRGDKIDEALINIDSIINKTNEKNLQNEERLKYLKLEIENIKSTMVSTLDSQKSVVLQELGSLEKEISDLKKLLSNSNISFGDKSTIELRPEEKLKSFKIPPASSVPSANDILATSGSSAAAAGNGSDSVTNTNADTRPDWQKYADQVQQQDEQNSNKNNIPTWQQSYSLNGDSNNNSNNNVIEESESNNGKDNSGIPAWQLRS